MQVIISIFFVSFLLFSNCIYSQFITPSAASNYKHLYKSCSMCDYSIEADGSSISSTDNITFSTVAIKDGFYTIGSTDSNL